MVPGGGHSEQVGRNTRVEWQPGRWDVFQWMVLVYKEEYLFMMVSGYYFVRGLWVALWWEMGDGYNRFVLCSIKSLYLNPRNLGNPMTDE